MARHLRASVLKDRDWHIAAGRDRSLTTIESPGLHSSAGLGGKNWAVDEVDTPERGHLS